MSMLMNSSSVSMECLEGFIEVALLVRKDNRLAIAGLEDAIAVEVR